MIRGLLALVAGIGMGYGAMTSMAANPPSPFQPNADVYEVANFPSPALQTLNPVTQAIKGGVREIRFRWVVEAGCSAGNMHDTLLRANAVGYQETGTQLIEDSANYRFSIHANCGVSQANICGGPPVVACLGRGWPYVDDVDASTIMASFYDQSQISVWWHEVWGHALETAAEGYCVQGSGGLCAGAALFSPAPNYVSYMNTGELSRTGPDWPAIDTDRWSRVMYDLAPDCSPGPVNGDGLSWHPCEARWFNASGWSYEPATGIWYDQKGVAQFLQCNGDHLHWSPPQSRWEIPGQNIGFDPPLGLYVVVPPC